MVNRDREDMGDRERKLWVLAVAVLCGVAVGEAAAMIMTSMGGGVGECLAYGAGAFVAAVMLTLLVTSFYRS